MESRRDRKLKTLHDAATDIQASDSVDTVCERTVAAAEDILEFELCTIMLASDGWLEPVAMSSDAPPDGARRMRVDQGLAGKTYQTQESHIVDHMEPDDETDPAKDSYRSGLSVPIDEYGVFQAASTEPAGFDETDVELAELLLAHTAGAIERTRFEADLQASQDALERQNDRLSKFASIVSHDLRNPLNVAQGRLELARTECDSDHLDAITRAHDRMDALIEDLLALSQRGGSTEERTDVDLATLVEECWETLDTADARLVVETGLAIEADRSRLKQLLENLLRNSVEHGGEAVTITVGALEDGPGFFVADDGPGIPPAEHEQVFEWGYSTGTSSTGFGLAIVDDIAAAHDWTIGVTASESGGARFEIRGVETP